MEPIQVDSVASFQCWPSVGISTDYTRELLQEQEYVRLIGQ